MFHRPLIRTPLIATLLLLVAGLSAGCVQYSTGPDEVGIVVRKVTLFGAVDRMTVQKPQSISYQLPFMTEFHTLTRTIRRLCMATSLANCGISENHATDVIHEDALEVKTRDGNTIVFTLLVEFRIDEQQAPFILENVGRSDREISDIVVRSIVRGLPRDLFGELTTQDLKSAETSSGEENGTVSPIRRMETRVHEALREALAPYKIEVVKFIYYDHQFNREYQDLVDEQKRIEEAIGKFKEKINIQKEENKLLLAKARADAAGKRKEADAEYVKVVRAAEAGLEQKRLEAEAIREEGRAQAEAMRLLNESLAGKGGTRLIKLRLAEVLEGKRIVLLPLGGGGLDLRTTDVNDLLTLYGIKSLSGTRSQAASSPSGAPNP